MISDQQLIDALRRLDVPASPEPTFKDGLRRLVFDSVGTSSPTGTPVARLVPLSAAALAVLVVGVLAALVLRPDSRPGQLPTVPAASSPATAVPTGTVPLEVPFRYRVPEGIHLEENRQALPSFVELIDGPAPSGQSLGGQYGRSGDQIELARRGIEIASLRGDVVTHPCPIDASGRSRLPIRKEQPGFLDDLGSVGGMRFDPAIPTSVGSRPAISTRLADAACDTADFHVNGGYVDLDIPSRLIVVDVDGVTVAIQVWARNEAELAEWLPIATTIVESIEFDTP